MAQLFEAKLLGVRARVVSLRYNGILKVSSEGQSYKSDYYPQHC